MQPRRASLLLLGLLGAGLGACTSDDTPGVTPDAGPPSVFDASVDGTVGHDSGPGADAGRDTAVAQDSGPGEDGGLDATAADARVEDGGDAGASGDAQADAPVDGNGDGDAQPDAQVDAADAAPLLDDAGCPVPTGVVADAADAGLPSTGMALWLRADMGLATLDGGAVCRWDDLSGNARSFVPGTSTPPVADPAGISGKPGVTFTGSATWLVRHDVLGLGATSGRTIAVYGRSADTTHRHQFLLQAAPGTPGVYAGVDANTYMTAGSLEGVYVANNSFDSNVATSTAPHSHLLSIASLVVGTPLPSSLVYAIDGTVTTLTKRAGSGAVEDFSGANTTWLGTATDTLFTTGELGEVLVYDHALSASERTAVAQYFQGRYP